MVWSFLLPLMILGGIGFLYSNGYISAASKSALTFVGSFPEKQRISYSFTSCNGWVRRVVKVKENGNYRFCLGGIRSKGSVQVTLMDRNNFPLLILTEKQLEGSAYLQSNMRCYLQVQFFSASGDCSIRWEQVL